MIYYNFILCGFVLYYLPLIPAAITLISITTSSVYKIYSVNNRSLNSDIRALPSILYKTLVFVIVYSLVYLNFLNHTIPTIIDFQVNFFSLSILIVICCILRNGSSRESFLDAALFFSFISMAAYMLLTNTDLVSIFFILEFLNILVLYSFFFSNNISNISNKFSAVNKIASSCVYQIILNFFSSIILYVSILSYISYLGGASLHLLKFLSYSDSYLDIGSILYLSLIIKLGVGPWILYKINIYSNMNFFIIYVYTIVYGCLIIVSLLNFVIIYGLSLSVFWKNLILFLLANIVIMFSSVSFTNQNIFIFLSFSSLLNFFIFIIQSVSVVFK